jgi:hypothetical protein
VGFQFESFPEGIRSTSPLTVELDDLVIGDLASVAPDVPVGPVRYAEAVSLLHTRITAGEALGGGGGSLSAASQVGRRSWIFPFDKGSIFEYCADDWRFAGASLFYPTEERDILEASTLAIEIDGVRQETMRTPIFPGAEAEGERGLGVTQGALLAPGSIAPGYHLHRLIIEGPQPESTDTVFRIVDCAR